jgi:Reverse transcriptase (RNA-dependent DNA polymerase)
LTLSGLLVFEQLDDQKFLSITTNFENNGQTEKCKAKYFTKLDIRWGYNNIRIRKGDEWKAAFKTNKGLFKPTVMFFGMCNFLATFQAMMDNIFMMMIDQQLVIVYMDDILIFAEMKELQRITKQVLEKL